MHGRETAEGHEIADLDVAGQRRAVGEHDVVADHTVVGDMRVRHEQIVVTDAGDALVVGRAPVDAAILAKDVAIADFQPCRLAVVLLVLGRIPDGGELEDAVLRADARRSVDDGVRTHDRAGPDLHVGADHTERPDGDIRCELCPRRYDGPRIDHFPASGASIISA